MSTRREVNVGVHSAGSPSQFNLSIFTENRISVPQDTPGTLPSTLGDVGGIRLPQPVVKVVALGPVDAGANAPPLWSYGA